MATTTRTTTDDFRAVVHLESAPEAVYAAVATPEGISGWWGPAAGARTPGGELTVRSS
jgi:uncharacterized protein YndB with AHSA1/START domain